MGRKFIYKFQLRLHDPSLINRTELHSIATYKTRVMLPFGKKDSVPTTQKSCVVYEFSCRCEARYIGLTTQKLADKIKSMYPCTHQCLHRKSCLPWHTKKAMPHSQALRYSRICSEDRQLQGRLGELAGWLNNRCFEESLVNEQTDRVRRLDRGTLLATKGRELNRGRDDRIQLVIIYHPALNSVGKH